MKYRLAYLEEHILTDWVSPEQFIIDFTIETAMDVDSLEEMKEWCSNNDIYMISTLVYFDTFDQRVEFMLRWL